MAHTRNFQEIASRARFARLIPYSKHRTTLADAFVVARQVKFRSLTQGPGITTFEKSVKQYVNSDYAVAVSSATAGLHIALLALELEPDSEVITTPLSFLASANCILYAGLKPVFVDIDPSSKNLDKAQVENVLRNNPKIKAVIAVHYAGLPLDAAWFAKLKVEFGVKIIEDAAHALGANYENGEKVGSSRNTDLTVFSFHPVKSVTTGEGGVVVTNSPELNHRLLRFRSHGIEQDPSLYSNKLLSHTNHIPNPWYREMTSLGYHYRMTELQASLGINQMKKLSKFISSRRRLAENYNLLLQGNQIMKPAQIIDTSRSAHHLYPVEINYTLTQISRAKLMLELRKNGIGTQVHYMPINMNPYYRALGYECEKVPNALSYYSRALSIPLYPGLTFKQQKFIINSAMKILTQEKIQLD